MDRMINKFVAISLLLISIVGAIVSFVMMHDIIMLVFIIMVISSMAVVVND